MDLRLKTRRDLIQGLLNILSLLRPRKDGFTIDEDQQRLL